MTFEFNWDFHIWLLLFYVTGMISGIAIGIQLMSIKYSKRIKELEKKYK